MNIGERLKTIAFFVPRGHILADIGTDHALLPIYLVKTSICHKVIATEVRKGPFERAVKNVKKAGLDKAIEIRLGSGFEPIKPGEAQIAVISGMGAHTIAGIFENSMKVAQRFELIILQPMTNPPKLRKQLFEMGFQIIDEEVAQECYKFYEIISAKKNTQLCRYDEIDINVGPVLRQKKDMHVINYIKHRVSKLEKLIKLLKNTNTTTGQKALAVYLKELEMLKEVLK